MQIDRELDRVQDPDRLAALEALRVLDTLPEEGFDDVVHLASLVCETPVALVSLVAADRQWFKAAVGFPDCETDLNRSVCAHALGETDLLVIADLAADPRTSANPLVTGDPFIRFYAGAPLRLVTGEVLGSLCVIDTAPRPDGLTPEQADSLRRLARQVVSRLELRRALTERDAALAEQRSMLRERDAQVRAQAVVFASRGDLDLIVDALVSSALEATPAADAGVLELIDGDELEYRAVKGSIAHHIGLRVPLHGSLAGLCARTNTPLLVEDVLKDNRTSKDLLKTLNLRSAIFAPVSRGDTVLGVLKLQSSKPGAFGERDLNAVRLWAGLATAGLTQVSEARAHGAMRTSEARYRTVFDSAADYAIIVMDLDGRVLDWNRGAIKILGWSADEMHGQTADRIFTPEDREAGVPAQEMRAALEHPRGIDERWHLRKSGERFFAQGELIALRYDDGQPFGFVKILRDRTDQRLLVDRLQVSDRHNAALVELGDRLRDLTSVADITTAASDVLGRTLDVDLVGYGSVDADAGTISVERDWTANGAPPLVGTLRFLDFGTYIDDLRHGETVVVTDARRDPRTASHAEALEGRHARAFVNMPVLEHGVLLALLFVCTSRPRAWSGPELGFIRDVADRVRTATARAHAEHQQRVLNEELSHRLKNTFAMVQAIASQSLKGLGDHDAVKVFQERLLALGSAHDLLLRQEWDAAPIDAVIRGAVRIHADSQRFEIEGPRLELNAKAVLSLSLLLHELATNAAKYGALSTSDGRVRLTCSVQGHDARAEVVLTWVEHGGPPAVEPARRGFGSRLIRMGLAGTGQASLRYGSEGFQAEFRAPLNVVTNR